MSYILEALRKSEEERKQDKIPILQQLSTVRQPVPLRPNRPSAKRLGWVAVLLLLCAVVFAVIGRRDRPWHIITRQGQRTEQRSQESMTRGGLETGSGLDLEKIPAGSSRIPATGSSKTAGQPLHREKADVLVINRQDRNSIPATNLPLSVQHDLRSMRFAGHAYSQDRSLRLIMINDKILHEGDRIDTDLRLEEISEDGVVLLYHATRIRINLFSPTH